MAKKKAQEDFGEKLRQSYAHWQHLYENGGSDPTWPDGVNLNLVRNHIIYYKCQLEEAHPTLYGLPEVYYRDLPPEVDQEYMARPDEIRAAAKVSLARYQADPDYQYLCTRIDTMNPKDINKTCIANVIGYVTGLEQAISANDLVHMRRHRNAENYLDAFSSCAQKVKDLKPPENEQLSFFYHYDHDDGPEYEDDEDEMEW